MKLRLWWILGMVGVGVVAAEPEKPATNAVVPVLDPATGFALGTTPGDPVERSYERLLADDDAAQAEMDRWIREADAQGHTADQEALAKKIQDRVAKMDNAYREFLRKNPDHVRATIAFGSFLNETGREPEAVALWEKAVKLDPKNPAPYNNLAGYYGHRGPVTNAFLYFEKALSLAPDEPVYHHNFGTVVFLFRKDVMEHYALTNEQLVFDKALHHYREAQRLDPTNFILATDIAQTFYGIKPTRYDEAMAAWRRAFQLASDDLEREGVRTHLARVQLQSGHFDEARKELNLVTNANYAEIKTRLLRTIERKEKGDTNAPAGGGAVDDK